MDSGEHKNSDDEHKELQRKIYLLDNQISALSDQVWALLRDGKEQMKAICDQMDANIPLSESDSLFLRGMVGCMLAELSCREAGR